MDPMRSLWYVGLRMSHVIVYCTGWVLDRAPCIKEALFDFVKFWIPINGTQRCGIELHDIHKHSVG